MYLVSQNLMKYEDQRNDAVLRVNMAWAKSIEDIENDLNLFKDRVIFLDFPMGRRKAPIPVLTLRDAYSVMKRYENIKYFAISNVEDVAMVKSVQQELNSIRTGIEFVPKIETLTGVKNLTNLIKDCGIHTIMLDKEDIFGDISRHNNLFFWCVDEVRKVCGELDVELLELEAVVFIGHKKLIYN